MQTKHLSPADTEAFGAELDDLLRRTKADLGERDVRYIRRVRRLQLSLELAGRGLLFAGFFPPAWILGTAALSLSKIIENMEVGHNILHGQYDFSGDPALSSKTYEWDSVSPADQWRHSHNYLHHTYTNVREVDADLGYRMLRIEESQPWRWTTLFQPFYALTLAVLFQWGVAVHDVDFRKYLTDPSSRTDETRAKVRGIRNKALKQVLKDYLLFPLLSGPSFFFVLAGNATANLVRNVWAFLVIFCGHFPDGTETFPAEALEGETRGAFYLRQIAGSANFDGSKLLHFMSGHLSHQIEHHMFPDIPAHRYPELSVEVRAICARYGVAYNRGSLGGQLWSVVKKMHEGARPSSVNCPKSGVREKSFVSHMHPLSKRLELVAT
jgi:NADPH-dependent stearoyl-CoA 9-desaturase